MSKTALWMIRRLSCEELQQRLDDLGEGRVVAQEGGAQPVHAERLLGHVALGIEVAVEGAAGRQMVDQLQGRHLHQAVALLRVEAGGLGVQDDLAQHARTPALRS